MRIHPWSVVLIGSFGIALECGDWKIFAGPGNDLVANPSRPLVTHVTGFKNLSGVDYVIGCDFQLHGMVTLVDTNRNLVVLQDATGAVALNFPVADKSLQVGQVVTLRGENGCPYVPNFLDFPHRPSERNVSPSFEVPIDLNEYRLTRMRGYLRPPATGKYTFWIASDNSSELWLSPTPDPSKARKIAFLPPFGWALPREWSHFPSQRSEPILLQAGEAYYIEALSEQALGDEYLGVAWQGPGLEQSVIESSCLTPWGTTLTNGILRECWTNFSAGSLDGLTGLRGFESGLTVEKVRVISSEPGEFPKPDRLPLNQQLSPGDNYRWVQAEGVVRFAGADGNTAFCELSDGQAIVQVRVAHWTPELSRRIRKAPVRVEGVCEGVFDQNGTLTPGLIWASAETSITFLSPSAKTARILAADQDAQFVTPPAPAMQGYYGTRGVVTFNGRVFGHDYTFVQEDAAAILVSLTNNAYGNHLNVGAWLDLGGSLEPGKHVPILRPLVVKELGWHSLPPPISQPLDFRALGNREGRWNEIEGVVHSVNSNGTLSVVGKNGTVYLWIGQTSSSHLNCYVDALLRVRGVLMLHLLDAPVLLVPSRQFVDVVKEPPRDPLAAPRTFIADLSPDFLESLRLHRVRVIGQVTYRDEQSFFIQDGSGGIRVRTSEPQTVEIGKTLEVLAFPVVNGFATSLTEPQVRPATAIRCVIAKNLDLTDAFSSRQKGALVEVSATVLARRTNATSQVLELQEQQRVFTAMLPAGHGNLPAMTAGSRLRVIGVCDDETSAGSYASDKLRRAQGLPSLNILLRSPHDVTMLSGPPWWTLKRTAMLVGMLLLVSVIALLWVHLLRRRLERQQVAQLAFSREVLERLEDERRRIAVNLHDSLGQVLLAIKNHALLAIQRPPDEREWRERLDEISEISSLAIEEVRQITHGLRPYQLDRLGLAQAIRTLISQASVNRSISVASRVDDIDGLFDKDTEIHVYRIVQEAVANLVKHSNATEAAVVIKRRVTRVSLSIRDNGRGFDPEKPSPRPLDLGYGLSGIAERVRILGGTLVVDSQPGAGASLTIEVPLPADKYDPGNFRADRG